MSDTTTAPVQDYPPTVIPFDLGAGNPTGAEIAKAVGCELRDLNEWLRARPEFVKELNRGRAQWDADHGVIIEKALVHSAVGGIEERLVKGRNGTLTREEIVIPPNQKSMEKYLEIRDPGRWKESDAPPPRLVPPTVLVQINNRLEAAGAAPVRVSHIEVPPPTAP